MGILLLNFERGLIRRVLTVQLKLLSLQIEEILAVARVMAGYLGNLQIMLYLGICVKVVAGFILIMLKELEQPYQQILGIILQ